MADSLLLPYTRMINARGQGALRPLVPLTLLYGGKAVEASGLLDTGADVNVLPYSLGIALGAVWEDQSMTIELSGNLAEFEARGMMLTATIGQFEPVKLAFAWTRSEEVPLLLEQINFFAEYDVCFYGSKNSFDVQPKGKV